jgi:methionyl-tRNA synthetase
LHEYLVDFPGKQDVLRYTLAANAPEAKDNDFTWKDFQTRNNSELLAIFGNFVNRTLVLTHKYFGGVVPATGEMNDYDSQTISEISGFPDRIAASIEAYRFREALNEMMNLARLGNKYLTETEPWKNFASNPEKVKTNLNISLQICANLAILCEPFLPFTAGKLLEMLNTPQMTWSDAGSCTLIEPGHTLNAPAFLFDRIEDDVIAAQIKRLTDTKAENAAENSVIAEQKPEITYDDFTKLDMRTGTIIEAEKVPKTAKLLKLTVDTGLDKRTVVSGIAEHYTPEQVIGQKVVILANLAPRNLKGIESKGMILMAENKEGKLCFVSPTEAFGNGSEVR